jgi:hypothetical protein
MKRTIPPAVRTAIGRTRFRLRLQRALEAWTTAGVVWALYATALVFLFKARILGLERFWLLQACGGALLLLAGLIALARRVPAARVAKRIDESHALHDRLTTALEFNAAAERTDFMRAHVEDAERHAGSVVPKRAAPYRWPRDLRALALLLACLGFTLVLRFPTRAPAAVPVKPLAKLVVDPDELEPHRALAKELQREAQEQNQPEIEKLANELNKLFDQIQKQELTRKELFAKLAELEKKYLEGMEGNFDELKKKLKKMGEEMSKEKLTEDLAKALKESDLQQAKKDMEKLAKELEKMKEKDKQALARSLKRSAKEKLDENALKKKIDENEKQIRRLKKELEKKKNDEQTKRRLQRKERQLQRLNQEQQKLAQQQRQLQRLNQEMQKAAQDLWNKLSPEAKKALQQAAQQMGKFANEQTKQSMLGKAQGQLVDLKELLRRLGQGKGQKGKLADFIMRAGGKKPGQGQGKDGKDGKDGKQGILLDPNGKDGSLVMPVPGQGQGQQPGQQGQGQDSPQGAPGNGIGTSTDPNLMGRASKLKAQHKSEMLRGKDGKGPSRSEVILGAADKGFSGQGYRKVYVDYTQIIEETLKQEDVPLGYKYFVKRYFQLIKPR